MMTLLPNVIHINSISTGVYQNCNYVVDICYKYII